MDNFRHIIFDLDGTLTDPGTGITRSIQYALEKYGIKAEKEFLYKFIGPPLRESFSRYFGFSSEEAEEAVSYYREYFSETGIYENEVYPGIPELLRDIKSSGGMIYVATTKPSVYAERILRHFGLYRYFSAIAGSNLDGTNGSKDELIAGLINRYSIDKSESAVMIGDRKYDIEGAKANGIYSVGVTYGYGESEELIEASPDYIAETVSALRSILLR